MSSLAIALANVEVTSVIEEMKIKTSSTKHDCYANYSEEEKVKVAKQLQMRCGHEILLIQKTFFS